MMRLAWVCVAAACALPLAALAQAPAAPSAACPSSEQTTQVQLLGLWRAVFDGLPQAATLLLEQHPELAQSVRGGINRNGERGLVAGDVDQGEFTLEESVDGVHISATWSGTVVDGSCGREIRGDWQAAKGGAARPFVLRKLP